MAAEDTTVYTLSAGYLPTLGFKKGDFKVRRKTSGKARKTPVGTKYDGSFIVIGQDSIVGKDGQLKKGRIRGSLGWFEYSTSIRAVNELLTRNSTYVQELQAMADKWYKKDESSLNQALLREMTQEITKGVEGGEGWAPKGSDAGAGGRGHRKVSGDRGTEEEQADKYKTHPEDTMATLTGQANAVDIYMKDPVTGDIIRLDVTAMTMSTKGAHHGLSSLEDRMDKGVDNESILEEIKTGGFHIGSPIQKTMHGYFQGLQDKDWNPKIKKLKDWIDKNGTESSKRTLNRLRNYNASLSDDRQEFRDLLQELRPAFGKAGARVSPTYASAYAQAEAATAAQKEEDKWKFNAYNLVNATVNEQNQKTWGAFKTHARGEMFKSSTQFVLHSLGNIIEMFQRGPDGQAATQGKYSTGYSVDGNFVIEVMHQIYRSGSDVFEFIKLANNHVLIHNEAHLSQVYMKKLGLVGRDTADAELEQLARSNNEDRAAAIIAGYGNSIEIGTMVNASTPDWMPRPVQSSASVITPSRINSDISKFIEEMTARKVGNEKMHALLSKRIRNLSKDKRHQGNYSFGNVMPEPYGRRRRDEAGILYNVPHKGMKQFGTDKRYEVTTDMEKILGGAHPTKGMYWGLGDYMNTQSQGNFTENVQPQFWAAPYFSILYPSTQVSVAKEKY